MKKTTRFALMIAALSAFTLSFTSCEPENGPENDSQYADRTYGNEAVASCESLINQLNAATKKRFIRQMRSYCDVTTES